MLLATAELPRDNKLFLFFSSDGWVLSADAECQRVLSHPGQEHSCQAMAAFVAKALDKNLKPRVLLSGLGLGLTLSSLLDQVSAHANVIVAEWVEEVVEWNRQQLSPQSRQSTEDPRVEFITYDVARLLRTVRDKRYDAIVLDTDDGPDDLVFPENDWLYTFSGLSACYQALEPGGVLAIWAKDNNELLRGKLVRAGFMVEAHSVAESDGTERVIWMAERLGRD